MLPSPLLLASVLKPLNDTRMFGKFGRTLAAWPSVAVHIAGREAPHPTDAPPNLHTHALLSGSRLSWQRLEAQWRYWKLLRTLQPALVIVHAPELLPLTLCWQLLRPMRRGFLYDVRENYALNILTQQVYPRFVRRGVAWLVRSIESLAARRARKILLAERSYAEELPFARSDNTIILENKYQPQPGEILPTISKSISYISDPLELLYSGTLSELNGVFDAIAFTCRLRTVWPQAHLTIIGFCQQPEVLARLRAAVAAAEGAVTLIGGDRLVPHAAIVAAVQRSHVGLLPYRPHPSTWRCLPTKLFEYMAHGLPVIVPHNKLWVSYLIDYPKVICSDFAAAPAAETAAALLDAASAPRGLPAGVLWASEEAKLRTVVASCG